MPGVTKNPAYSAWIANTQMPWPTASIRRLNRVKNGGTPASQNSKFWGGDVMWLTPDDLGRLSGKTISSSQRTITQEGVLASNADPVPSGSLILSTRAPIGHVAISDRETTFNQGCRAIVPSDKYDSFFLYYYLCACRPILEASGNGTTFRELSWEELASLPIPTLARPLQVQIANFLDRETARIDALVEKKRRLVELLEERGLAIITHAVTKGLNPKAPMKDSGIAWLGQIPLPWEVKPLRRLLAVDTRNGLYKPRDQFSENGVPFLQMGEAFAEPIFIGPATDRVLATPDELSTWGLEKGDLIFARRSLVFEGSGKCSLIGEINEPHLLESSMIRVRLATQFIAPEYAFAFFRSQFSRATILAQTKQVTISGIDSQQLKALPIVVPPLKEQAEILGTIQCVSSRIGELAYKIRLACRQLQEYRSALITNAVTGKIDVRGSAKKEAAA